MAGRQASSGPDTQQRPCERDEAEVRLYPTPPLPAHRTTGVAEGRRPLQATIRPRQHDDEAAFPANRLRGPAIAPKGERPLHGGKAFARHARPLAAVFRRSIVQRFPMPSARDGARKRRWRQAKYYAKI